MNRGNPRRRRGRGRGRGAMSLQNRLTRLEHSLTGLWVRGPSDPPSINSAPWNSVIISSQMNILTAPTGNWEQRSTNNLRNYVKVQIGLPAETGIEIRLTRLDFWNVKQTGSNPGQYFNGLGVRIRDFTQGSPASLTYQEDIGTAINYAHMHYIYPKRIATYPIRNEDDRPIFEIDASMVTADLKLRVFVHYHCLWRCEVPDIARRMAICNISEPLDEPDDTDSNDEFNLVHPWEHPECTQGISAKYSWA